MYKLSSRFVTEILDKKMVLLDTKTLLLYHLNETASFIVKKIIKKISKEEVAVLLIKKYDISQSKAHKDIEKLLTELQRKKIIISQ